MYQILSLQNPVKLYLLIIACIHRPFHIAGYVDGIFGNIFETFATSCLSFASQPILANNVLINPLSLVIPGSSSVGPSGPSVTSGGLVDGGLVVGGVGVGLVGGGGVGGGGVDLEFGCSIIERRQKLSSLPSSCVKNPFSFASYLR